MPANTPVAGLTIRTADASDAVGLVAAIDEVAHEGRFFLRNRFGQDPEVEAAFIELTTNRGGTVLVAEAEGQIVGWLTLQRDRAPFRRHVCILGMGIRKAFRGQGIGRRVLDEGLRFARASDEIERVELTVRATNLAAIALYQTAGFRYEGRRMRAVRDSAGRYDDEILMAQATTTT